MPVLTCIYECLPKLSTIISNFESFLENLTFESFAMVSESDGDPESVKGFCGECSEIIFIDEKEIENLICANCKSYIHLECAAMSSKVFEFFKNNSKSAKFYCSGCIHFNDKFDLVMNKLISIEDKLGMHNEKLAIHEKKLQSLPNEVLQFGGKKVSNPATPKRKFNEVVSMNVSDTEASQSSNKLFKPAIKKRSEPNPVVIITPKNDEFKANMKNAIKKAVHPKHDPVTKVSETISGKIVVECSSQKDTAIVQHKLIGAIGDGYNIDLPKSKKPVICVPSVDVDDVDSFISFICTQNDFSISETDVEVIDIKKNRNQKVATVYVRLSYNAFESIMSIGKVYIGWNRCNVFEHFDVYRCYQCQEFGHAAANCKNDVCCPKCSGNHKVGECESNQVNCVNCERANKKFNFLTPLNPDHAAWSPFCPSLVRKREQVEKRTRYSKL